MTEEQQLIFDVISNVPTSIYDSSVLLHRMYESLNEKWFGSALPQLSETFICEFCGMPREAAGIFLDVNRAQQYSIDTVKIRPGMRINSKLQEWTDHVKIALLHEMVHATGIDGHDDRFIASIQRLISEGAYTKTL